MSSGTVILAHSFTRSGLAVARSLGRQGLTVISVATNSDHMVARSRYVSENVVAPDPVTDEFGFAEAVAALAKQHDAELVIPITDAALTALNENRSCFDGQQCVALPPYAAVVNVLDKRQNLAMAESLGVPCPQRYDLRRREDVPDMVGTLGFPIVLKDPGPGDLPPERPLPFRIAIAEDRTELDRLLDQVDACDVTPLFQQRIVGASICICMFAIEGELIASHSYTSYRRSTREGIAREIIELDPVLAEYSRQMIKELRWTGVAHTQFLVNPETGTCAYMETNGRFWASTQGSFNAGWDFPRWLYEYYVNGKRPDVGRIDIGSRTVFRRGDIENLLRYLGGREVAPPGYAGKWPAVRQTLGDFRPGVHSDVWQWSDLRPALHDFRQLVNWTNVKKLLGIKS